MAGMSERLDAVVDGLQQAVLWQDRNFHTTHAEFYAWGWALSTLAAELARAATVLDRQVENYMNRWELADDEGLDPVVRINRTCGLLERLAAELGTASSTARAYHNEAAHIAVDDPEWEMS